MEKELRIRLDQKHALYGLLSGSFKKPLIIIVHGLPDNINAGLHEEACKWFTKHGYATFRFNLYSWQNDARQLMDCTLKTHAADLDMVVDHFKKRGVKKIFVIGHSFGGPTVLLSQKQRMNAVVLWDPSYDLSFTKTRYDVPGGKFIKQLNGYLMPWGANVVLSNAMVREVDGLSWDDLPKKFHIPLHIIAAGGGVLVSGAKQYLKNAHKPKRLSIIPKAGHYFEQSPKMREELFKKTKQWFEEV